MAMFQYCDHMHLCVYKIVCDVCLCVCTICCRSVAGFDLHRISISSSACVSISSSSTCVCLSELHHITSSCSSSASSALLAGAAPGDASCTCQISQMQPHCQMSSDAAIVEVPHTIISSISVAQSCFQKKIQFCWIFLYWNEKNIWLGVW